MNIKSHTDDVLRIATIEHHHLILAAPMESVSDTGINLVHDIAD